ncbi:MAG: type II toxin-antitoxin system HipA family toxin [Bacteroidota bacterium]
MTEFVDVSLWGENIGVLTWDKNRDIAIFQYTSDFVSKGLNIAPFAMPLSLNPYLFSENKNNCFKGLPGLIADALPDNYGSQIIESWFQSKGYNLTNITPLDQLCYVGSRGMGALDFKPSLDNKLLDISSTFEINKLVELAQQTLNNRKLFQTLWASEDPTLLDLIRVGTSAGGAKPKAIIAYNKKTKEVRSGQVKAPKDFEYFLLKFDGFSEVNYNDNSLGVGAIEYAYYLMAKDCGIKMMQSELVKEDKQAHFMTKRFDRTDDGEKVFVQTLAAIGHLNRDIPQSYETMLRLMRGLGMPHIDFEEMFKRIVFNVVSRNHDDHTKNHSFIMSKKGEWRLAPAYDLMYSNSPKSKWTAQHQMSVNGKRSDFSWSDLISFGKTADIHNPNHIIEQVVEVISKWGVYANSVSVEVKLIEEIQKNLLLIKK